MSTGKPSVNTPSPGRRRARASRRPWFPWLLTLPAYPLSGFVASVVVGPVDSVPHALLGGVVTGAGIGGAQWALLRRRGVGAGWAPATAAGLGAGLALGAALVSYRTDISSLALMGAVCGLAVGLAQAATLGRGRRILPWGVATAVLWAVGWAVTTAAGIDVEEQYTVFGASGVLVVTALQSTFIGALLDQRAVPTIGLAEATTRKVPS
jgi:hypothetical protein